LPQSTLRRAFAFAGNDGDDDDDDDDDDGDDNDDDDDDDDDDVVVVVVGIIAVRASVDGGCGVQNGKASIEYASLERMQCIADANSESVST
jgi:hypothetical protein